MTRLWISAVAVALLGGVGATAAQRPTAAAVAPGAQEVRPQFFKLPNWLEPRESMISGLAWYGDDLILLPQQRPIGGQRSLHRGKLYSIPRSALEREIDAPTGAPLPIDVWTLESPGIDTLKGFEGLEAIAFAGDPCS